MGSGVLAFKCNVRQGVTGFFHSAAVYMLSLCMLGNFSDFSSSADFFQNLLFQKFLSVLPLG